MCACHLQCLFRRAVWIVNQRAWLAALALAALLAWNGEALVRKVETMPFPGSPGLRADPTVDRALIAERAIASLRESALPAHARLAFWSPIGRSFAARQKADRLLFGKN